MGINPYSEYLAGDKQGIFIKAQTPNYAQTLYIIFIPFALVSNSIANLIWSLLNISMLIKCSLILRKIFSIESIISLIILFSILITGYPTIYAVTNGQLSIFTLTCFLMGISIKNKKYKFYQYIIFGMSYLKYSFAPCLSTLSLLRHGFKGFIFTFIPVITGVLLMLLRFKTISSVLGPIQVSHLDMMSHGLGSGDLLSILKVLFKGKENLIIFLSFVCVVLSMFLIWKSKFIKITSLLPLVSLASLMFVNHFVYDYVFYFVLLAYAFSKYSTKIEKLSIATSWAYIGYLSWIFRTLDYTFQDLKLIFISFVLNLINFIIIYCSQKSNNLNINLGKG